MKNKIELQFLKKMFFYTVLFMIVQFIAQIALSSVFEWESMTSIVGNYLDASLILGKKQGWIKIYYTDMIRILCIFLLIVPYTIALTKMIHNLVVKPIEKLTKAIEEIDQEHLPEKIDTSVRYEFANLQFIFNELLTRLIKANEEQKKSERDRDLLITGMAHDLKTPITTIRGYSQALAEGVIAEPSRQEEYLTAINKKAIQLDELIMLLFDYVRLGTSQYQMEYKSIDLVENIRENIGLFYTDFEKKGITFLFNLPEKPMRIRADSTQLNRVFANIYSNALKFNDRGNCVNTKIDLIKNEENCEIVVKIQDSGEPITQDLQKSIFSPFVKGDSSRSGCAGSGLGLSIAAKIIELHHGKMSLENEDGNPYTKSFVIRIPYNRV